jgi:predicted Zn-dependent peptidase
MPDAKLQQLMERIAKLDDNALDRLRQSIMAEAQMTDDDEPDAAVEDALEIIDDEIERRDRIAER